MPSNKNGVATSSKPTITPPDLRDTLAENNLALRAFGTLLGTAKLSDFDSDNFYQGTQGKFEAESLQYGLSKLIDLYLANQEQVLESYVDEYIESDEYLLEKASELIKVTEEGAFITGHIPLAPFCKAINGLETIIDRNPTFRPMAEALKDSIMKYAPPEAKQNTQQEVA